MVDKSEIQAYHWNWAAYWLLSNRPQTTADRISRKISSVSFQFSFSFSFSFYLCFFFLFLFDTDECDLFILFDLNLKWIEIEGIYGKQNCVTNILILYRIEEGKEESVGEGVHIMKIEPQQYEIIEFHHWSEIEMLRIIGKSIGKSI